MKRLMWAAIFLISIHLVGCKDQATSKIVTSEVDVQVDKKTAALKEIIKYKPKIYKAFSNLGLKQIECPTYLRDTTGIRTDPTDVNTCFTSAQQPEELLPLLSDALKSFSEVSMGWRMDLGAWSTIRKFKSNQQFSITLGAPGLDPRARIDPKIKDVGTVATLFMGYDPHR